MSPVQAPARAKEKNVSKHHQLKISPIRYPGGLRIVECQICRYAFAAEINEAGVLDHTTRIQFNEGELEASHALFEVPTGPLVEISIEASF